jgi:hypothetical protein
LGATVPPDDVTALAAAMVSMSEHPRPNQARITEIHARIERDFSLIAVARHVTQLYETLMTAEPATAR